MGALVGKQSADETAAQGQAAGRRVGPRCRPLLLRHAVFEDPDLVGVVHPAQLGERVAQGFRPADASLGELHLPSERSIAKAEEQCVPEPARRPAGQGQAAIAAGGAGARTEPAFGIEQVGARAAGPPVLKLHHHGNSRRAAPPGAGAPSGRQGDAHARLRELLGEEAGEVAFDRAIADGVAAERVASREEVVDQPHSDAVIEQLGRVALADARSDRRGRRPRSVFASDCQRASHAAYISVPARLHGGHP